MSFFKKIFGKGQEPAQQGTPVSPTAPQTAQGLLEQYGGISLDKQRNLYDVIGDNSWNINMDTGEISFGPDLIFPVQVLGTFSHSSETWLWGWANAQSNISPDLLQQALQLKKYGEDHDIGLLKNRDFDAEINDLHLIGMIASGMFGASAYYLADYGQGIMVATIKSDVIDSVDSIDHVRVSTVFPEFISLFEMNHKNAFGHYATLKGYAVNEDGQQLIATKEGSRITAAFDDFARLTRLNG